MSQGTKFAIALALFMVASIGLFIAFHPNAATSASDLFSQMQQDLNQGNPAGGKTK